MNSKVKVLVTGSGGFIGSHLVTYLKNKGYWVRGVDIKLPEFSQTDADEFEILDLRRWDNCLQATRGVDEVYALAADMGGMGFIAHNHAQILYNNSLINLHTLEAARVNNVKRYLYTSSACVYPEYLQENANVTPLIDADMRRPRLHSIFQVSNEHGLSSILSNQLSEAEILNIIQQDTETNLYLLPSGAVPPNPAELIGSDQMSRLLKILEANFTHVVVDSPPIASFTDGVLISTMVDGVLLVVHSGKSSRQVIKRARQLLGEVGAKLFGVVLNNINLRSTDSNYYYQNYYSSYYNRDEDE